MAQDLAYGAPVGASKKKGIAGVQHILGNQEWDDIRVDVPMAVSGRKAFLQLAGTRENKEPNRFCFKHIMASSKKGKKSDEKLKGRLMHRVDRGGTKLKAEGNTVKPDAKKGEQILNRKDKYGEISPAQNTVIDLDVITLEIVLEKMVTQLVTEDAKGSWAAKTEKEVEFDFGLACVKSIDTAYNVTTASKMKVKAYKRDVDAYEVFHCEG